jgi:carboxyl-terminal processing protease
LPVPYEEITSPNGKRIGYILLPTFADNTVGERFSVALRALSESGPLDGLVIDNRQNNGGADNVTRDVLAYFTSGVMGHFVDRHGTERPFRVLGSEISGSSSIPLAVLVGPNTVSFGEIFAGILQDIRRAVLIGEPTQGNVELLWGYEFEDGSRAWIAQETFLPINDSSSSWEETGIIPDIAAPSNWDEITLDNDPAVQAAIEYFDAQ